MSLLDFLRTDIGDDVSVSAGTPPSGTCLLDFLRVDIGDDGALAPTLPPLASPDDFIKSIPSSTDGAVLVFDGTTGDTVRETLVNIDSSGNITTPGGICFGGFQAMGFRIISSTGPVTLQASDTILFINKTLSESTIVTIPSSTKTGREIIIKDMKGDASINNVTVAGTIDSFSAFILTQNYQSVSLIFNGTEWNVV